MLRRARKSNQKRNRILGSGVLKNEPLDRADAEGWWARINAPWDSATKSDDASRMCWSDPVLVVVLELAPILLIFVAVVVLKIGAASSDIHVTEVATAQDLISEEVEKSTHAAKSIAQAFLNEPEAQQRLQFVRNRGDVATHLKLYAKEALSELPVQLELRGRQVGSGMETTGFTVHFAEESYRLLNVVDTTIGPRVDWDSYARFCSASWDDILSGAVASAEVRVFVSPGDYYNTPFADETQWRCFRLVSPDLPGGIDVFAYAKIGSTREIQLRRIILRAKQFRQHMTLQIESCEAPGRERLFEITRALAVGWVRGDRDIEDDW